MEPTKEITVQAKTAAELISEIIALEDKRSQLDQMEREARKQIDRLVKQVKEECSDLLFKQFFATDADGDKYLCSIDPGTGELKTTKVSEIEELR